MKSLWAGICLLLAATLTLGAGGGENGNGKKFKGDIDAFFKKLDTNMDGKLSKDEFLRMADRAKEKDQVRARLSQANDKLDPEMKGITKEAFRRFLENGKNGASPENKSK